MNAGVSSEKEKVKESQSRRVAPRSTSTLGAGLGASHVECNKPFQTIKEYLTSPFLLSQPVEREELFFYLVASIIAVSITLIAVVSAALVKMDKEGRKKISYFVSKMLINAESCHTDFKRIALALRVVAKKLYPYFQAHTINVLSSYPIKAILHKLDASGILLKWAIELSEFDIVYRPRSAIKGRVLAELSDVLRASLPDLSILEINGSSKMVDNEVVYEVVLLGLRVSQPLSITILKLWCDSQLVASQIRGEYEEKNDMMA